MNKEELKPKMTECRYGEILNGLINEYAKIFLYGAEADYQGFVKIAWKEKYDNKKYYFYEYNYGSCSGCDDWESRGLTNWEIAQEMIRDTVKFDKKEDFIKFLDNYKSNEWDHVEKFYKKEGKDEPKL